MLIFYIRITMLGITRKSQTLVRLNNRCLFCVHKTRHKYERDAPQRRLSLSCVQRQNAGIRADLTKAKTIVVKLGSAVITREDECGIALGRLASIIEQVSELQNQGRQMLMVTSGAVAFGKQKLQQEIIMSMSMRETLVKRENIRAQPILEPRACAAAGQSGLMSLYEAMFMQYGVRTAQVLVTKPDFYNDESRKNLRGTLTELLKLNIIPILNANDAVAPPPEQDKDLAGIISVKDNDSLAARLSVEIGADLMIIMSDVDGLYTCPPGHPESRLLHTYSPLYSDTELIFGEKSRVGLGGMESKVNAATWALKLGVSAVICNGCEENAIVNSVKGKQVGTFFTLETNIGTPVEVQAMQARDGSRKLQALTGVQRAAVVNRLADLLLERKSDILAANQMDVRAAISTGLDAPLVSRLILNDRKLQTLADGLRKIADDSLNAVGKVLQRTQISDGMELTKITVPIGVLMVIFESRPDALPQVAALAICSGNGLLLKGGKEAINSNKMLHSIVMDALEPFVPRETVTLISRREDIEDLLHMKDYIDLVIPRGSRELIEKIEKSSHGIPVLGHSEGICHVYVDSSANADMATRIVRDAKCDYPAACNSMETLLLHRSHLSTPLFDRIFDMFKQENVKVHAGPRLAQSLKFGPSLATSMKTEYNALECNVELVEDIDEAIAHINKFGSAHTDTIVTENEEAARMFQGMVDSACVFHNASTRFADGYRFGLGAEVGLSTTRIHARGPVGIEGLLTSKWLLSGSGEVVSDFTEGKLDYIHKKLPVNDENEGSKSSDFHG